MQNISTCLWFDDKAEEAAAFYVSVFPNSRILDTRHFVEGSPRPAGSVMTVQFTLDGRELVALNGGPNVKFSPAMSLVAYCDTQEEVDTLWRKLCAGGQEGQCGWLTDKYGVSWQIVPRGAAQVAGHGRQGGLAARRRRHDEDAEARHRHLSTGLR